MPIGQNLLALMGAEMPRDKFAGLNAVKGESSETEGFGAFSSILAAQKPAELKALFSQLHQLQGDTVETEEALPGFAADGNSLPVEIKDWLQKLAMLESPVQSAAGASDEAADATGTGEQADQERLDLLAGLSSQWQQWLAQLPQEEDAASVGEAAAGADAAVDPRLLSVPGALADKATQPLTDAEFSAGLPGDKVIPATAGTLSLPDMLAQLRAAMSGAGAASAEDDGSARAATGADADAAGKGKALADGDEKLLNQARQANPTDQPQQAQRVASLAASMDAPGLAAARLAEQKGREPGKLDSNAIDGLAGQDRASAAANAAQNALTQRPVAAAVQAAAVPFGQSGWSESVVNKVMWMSSQNLKSVEIQLDPAELGPLEIKIQTRGLEHQVQFVSQNPGVREALEGQVHRLRELFSQQGVDQLDVSVSDGNSGQQSGSEARSSFAGGDGNGRGGSSLGGSAQVGGEDELPMAAAQSIVANNRLVDYYA
ncbi:flagellar hook-length control protein FliK [Halopseudomonas sabulinigri]|uniref:Flagellar hook-length control protein FliK n=1 Tax=Halopseudomonas sabulinigri TaxID=472181 RepID=A0A1H1Q2H5_9GAMM|nr:flagellar hook-length control protein FliK [Halopseudomonas sabulinigri]SDS17179.1 flagellar hook-length control protein FliK [Halopseudomonas sabulinigri]